LWLLQESARLLKGTTPLDKPLVSIIIDTYNYGTFIDKAIKSALEQDYPAGLFEIIVIDDGSTDDTAEKLKKYIGKVHYIRQKNTGQAGVFNTGFSVSKGELIAFLDADDFWYPAKLKTIAEAFDKYQDVGLVQHPSHYVDINAKMIARPLPRLPEFYTLESFFMDRLSFYGTSNLSFRRKFLKELIPEPLEMGNYADQYLYWNILFHSRIHNINEPLAAHRVHNTNWYAKMHKNLNMLRMHINVMEASNAIFIENLKKRNLPTDNPMPSIEEQKLDIIKEKIILNRKQWRLFSACQAFFAIFMHPLTTNTIFKASTYILAIISPSTYFLFYKIYTNVRLKAAK
jgi:glycosyltransferase involved in cell wall biosynthesis